MEFKTPAEAKSHLHNFFKKQESQPQYGHGNSSQESSASPEAQGIEDSSSQAAQSNIQSDVSLKEGPQGEKIFSQSSVVFQDDNVKVEVQAVSFQKASNIRLSDHLFLVKMTPKQSNSKPLLISLDEALQSALITIYDKLKSVYSSDNHHQIVTTVHSRHMLSGGISSGNFDLNSPSSTLARQIIARWYNFLKSDQTMTLDNSFKVYITILSTRHSNELAKKKNWKRHVFPRPKYH
jgi:hypothetical protein